MIEYFRQSIHDAFWLTGVSVVPVASSYSSLDVFDVPLVTLRRVAFHGFVSAFVVSSALSIAHIVSNNSPGPTISGNSPGGSLETPIIKGFEDQTISESFSEFSWRRLWNRLILGNPRFWGRSRHVNQLLNCSRNCDVS